jgi:PIN domain nuclease of toxin-antitoxin system
MAGARETPVTQEIVLVVRQLTLHQDPADHVLAATAQVLDSTLVTADNRIFGLGISKHRPTDKPYQPCSR